MIALDLTNNQQQYKFGTDSEIGTIEAASLEAAVETLRMFLTDPCGWVEDLDGRRVEIRS